MSQMEQGISNTGTYTHSKGTRKRKHHIGPYVIVSSQKKMFKQLHQEIKDENPYKASVSSEEPAVPGSQEAAKNDVEGAQNVPKECSMDDTQEAELSWKEFKDKMIKHISSFEGKVKNFGKTDGHFIVGVVEGGEKYVRNKIRSKITKRTDTIEIVEIKEAQGTIVFLGGNGQPRCISKPIKSGDKIVNVATEEYNVFGEACLQSGLTGTLTLLMEDTEHKYYGIAPGHIFIEDFEIAMLTKKFKSYPCKSDSRTVVCDVEYHDPPCESQRKKQILAEKVFRGIEMFEGGFMDCGWFEVDAANKAYLEFYLKNTDSPPTVFKDELVYGTEVCSINSPDFSRVDGQIVWEEACWCLGEGEDTVVICETFFVKGKNGCFAREGNSGEPVYDKDGNVFGMIIAYDRRMDYSKYPDGVAICIRLDHALNYVSKQGGPKLEVARQPDSSTSSSSDTGPSDQGNSGSTSGAAADIGGKMKSKEDSHTGSSSNTGSSDQSSSGSALGAFANTGGKMKSKEDSHTTSSSKTGSSDQSSSGSASGAFVDTCGKKKSKEGHSSKYTSIEESEKSRDEKNWNALAEALKQAETDQERIMIEKEMRQLQFYEDKRKKTKTKFKK